MNKAYGLNLKKKLLVIHQSTNKCKIKLQNKEKIICFVGLNGVGKTNILDAIYHLSYTKSYFNPIPSQNIKHGELFFFISCYLNEI